MEDYTKLREVLEKEIETRILPQKNYPYIPASALRARLNEAFNCFWDTKIISTEILNEDAVLTKLELIGHVGDKEIKKQGFGSAPIHKFNSGPNKGKPTNIGDAYGNSFTDALKACAKQLGIGNTDLDVTLDPKTRRYVKVGNKITTKPAVTTTTAVVPIVKPSEKVTEGPAAPTAPVEAPANTEAPLEESKEAKMLVLREKLNKIKKTTAAPTKLDKPVTTEVEAEPSVVEPSAVKIDVEVPVVEEKKAVEPVEPVESPEHGFDYTGIEEKTTAPKNTQKLVIANLAKMQKMPVDDYIEKVLGKSKALEDLTSEDAKKIVHSGLSSAFK